MKTALVTGITGQDGSYLTELLLEKGYHVHGLVRRSSGDNKNRLTDALGKPPEEESRLTIHYGDLTDAGSVAKIVAEVSPDEIYNLAAQSHVGVSFESPEYTADVNALGTLRLLEGIRTANLITKTKFYQASTSELYGLVYETPQRETTPFHPRSPYAVSKLYAYWIVKNYREAWGMFACNGILFNHESERRGEDFVTRKITLGLSRIFLGLQKSLYLGNLNSLRDWGHAKDYVNMQWRMLQQETARDYVIASGKQHSIREFLNWSAEALGFTLEFEGSGSEEVARVASISSQAETNLSPGDIVVRIDERFYRPSEVDSLLGDPQLAHDELGWRTTISVKEMCASMIERDLELARRQMHFK